MPNPTNHEQPALALVEIIGFSPLFGFFREAMAFDHGALPGQTRLHRVLLDGETAERIAPVYPELQGLFDAKIIAALNELVLSRACEFPRIIEDSSRIRAINLFAKGRR